MQLIDGKQISENIYTWIKLELQKLERTPKLAIILASQDEASLMYDRMKVKKAAELGIAAEIFSFPELTNADEIIAKIKQLNQDDNFTGIMVQLPLYEHLKKDRDQILNTIDPKKDVDGLTAKTLGKLLFYENGDILPATVDAILECLRFTMNDNLFEIKGKNVLILNNTNLIGKPLGVLLEQFDATVTVANEFTENINELMQNADIIVAATGKTNLIDHRMIKSGVTLIDVTSKKVSSGPTQNAENIQSEDDLQKSVITGDIIRSIELDQKAAFITPVPGGVGPLTIACLIRNLINLSQ